MREDKPNHKGWQRYRDALAMREQGLKLKEIGRRMGVSPERARQLVYMGRRLRAQESRKIHDE